MTTKMTAQEQGWEADDDARTLARYQEIKADKPRLGRAVTALDKLVKEAEKELKMKKQAARTSRREGGKKK